MGKTANLWVLCKLLSGLSILALHQPTCLGRDLFSTLPYITRIKLHLCSSDNIGALGRHRPSPTSSWSVSSWTHSGLWHPTLICLLLNTCTRDPGVCLCMFIGAAAPLLACSLSTADAVYPPVLFQPPALPVLYHLISMQHCLHGLHRSPSAFSELSLFSFKEQSHTLSFLKFIFTAYLFKEHF